MTSVARPRDPRTGRFVRVVGENKSARGAATAKVGRAYAAATSAAATAARAKMAYTHTRATGREAEAEWQAVAPSRSGADREALFASGGQACFLAEPYVGRRGQVLRAFPICTTQAPHAIDVRALHAALLRADRHGHAAIAKLAASLLAAVPSPAAPLPHGGPLGPPPPHGGPLRPPLPHGGPLRPPLQLGAAPLRRSSRLCGLAFLSVR